MKKKLFIFLNYIFLFLIITQKSYGFSSNPETLIREVVNNATNILSNADISKEDKRKEIEKIVYSTVDIKGLGYYALGSYRKDLSEDELKRYSVIYEKYFLKNITSRLEDYSDQKIEVVSAEIINAKYTMVESKLLSNGDKPEIKIVWRVYTKNPEVPLIRDLIVEGLSLARTQREEFSSIIQKNDGKILNLFTKLEEFINN